MLSMLILGMCFWLPAKATTILVLGDSISAAYGMENANGWVALASDELNETCTDVVVHNASVSGETSAGGRARLPALLNRYSPDIVFIELGGNDGLRGLPPQQMAENLRAMIHQTREQGATAILLGMRIPPNYGPQYTAFFEQQFHIVAKETAVLFMPFFLEGVVEKGWMQADGIHPSEAAQPTLARYALNLLTPLLTDACGEPQGS